MARTVPSQSLCLSWEPVRKLNSLEGPLEACALHIATLELSTLDQLFDYYNAVVLFYDAGNAGGQRDGGALSRSPVKTIRQALEGLLAHYPCAAGLLVHNKVSGRLEIRYPTLKYGDDVAYAQNGSSSMAMAGDAHDIRRSCGVPFKVAHANVSLADLGDVADPQPSLDVLMPAKPEEKLDGDGHPLPRFVMAVQVTLFKCGGFAIGHTCNHVYADGYTAAAFLRNLCALARGGDVAYSDLRVTSPRSAIIRPRDPPCPTVPLDNIISCYGPADKPDEQRLHYGTATRFQFSMEGLERLRERAATPGRKPCSRNTALMALLWTSLARVSFTERKLAGSLRFDMRFAINVREKLPASAGYMGNAVLMLRIPATLQELVGSDLASAAAKIQKVVEELDVGETFQSLVDYVELQARKGPRPLMRGSVGMPSLVRLPFYDTDCGWGPPVYVGRPSQQISDRCIIMNHPAAQAWNVLVVFPSAEERACFADCVTKYCRQ